MNKLNWDDDKEYEILINLKWPHEGFMVGYDIFQPTEDDDFKSVFVYLGFITLIFNWN